MHQYLIHDWGNIYHPRKGAFRLCDVDLRRLETSCESRKRVPNPHKCPRIMQMLICLRVTTPFPIPQSLSDFSKFSGSIGHYGRWQMRFPSWGFGLECEIAGRQRWSDRNRLASPFCWSLSGRIISEAWIPKTEYLTVEHVLGQDMHRLVRR